MSCTLGQHAYLVALSLAILRDVTLPKSEYLINIFTMPPSKLQSRHRRMLFLRNAVLTDLCPPPRLFLATATASSPTPSPSPRIASCNLADTSLTTQRSPPTAQASFWVFRIGLVYGIGFLVAYFSSLSPTIFIQNHFSFISIDSRGVLNSKTKARKSHYN